MSVPPNEPKGSPKVEPFKFEVRISLNEENKEKGFALAKAYNEYFKVDEYLWSFEIVDNNPHLHGMVDYKKREPAGSTMSDWFKKQSLKKQGPSTSHHTKVVDELKYGAYCLKDGQYITNIDKKKIDVLLERVNQVKESQKMDTRKKLLNLIKPKIEAINEKNKKIDEALNWDYDEPSKKIDVAEINENDEIIKKSCTNIRKNSPKTEKKQVITLADVTRMIFDVYHNDWDKDVPMGKIKSYTLYIAEKLNVCGDEIACHIQNLW